MLISNYITPVMFTDSTGYFWDTVLDVVSIVWSLYDFIKDPSWKNFGWIALDIGFALIPFLTGSKVLNQVSLLDDISEVRVLDNSMNNVIVIGQSMDSRVIPKAMNLGADYYAGYMHYSDLRKGSKILANTYGYADNMLFIATRSLAGYKFLDIGMDFKRVGSGLDRFSRFTIYSERIISNVFKLKNVVRGIYRFDNYGS